jgi:hypothetical protein
MITFDDLIVLGDFHRHARVACQDLRQHAFPLWCEMGNDDEGHAGIRRHHLEQMLERFDAARGRANSNDGKTLLHGFLARITRGGYRRRRQPSR